jgi:hypothetical protein
MHLTGLDLLFWAASFLGHAVLLVVLWIRRRATVFPLFTTLIAANVIRTIALYFVLHYGTKHTYFYTYWSLAIVDSALQLCVVYEMSSHVFRPLGVWAHDVRHGFIWLICGSIAIASGLTWLAAPTTRLWMQAAVIKGSFFSSALMSELFVGMIALSVTVGLPWKTPVARISQGLGIYSMIDVIVEAAHSYFGVGHDTRTYMALSHLRIATYLVCILYWIIMLWRDAPQPRDLPPNMRNQLFTLQRAVEYDLRKLRSWRRW